MTIRHGRRGQPLLALLLILTAWVGARAAFWDTAAPSASAPPAAGEHVSVAAAAPKWAARAIPAGPQSVPDPGAGARAGRGALEVPAMWGPAPFAIAEPAREMPARFRPSPPRQARTTASARGIDAGPRWFRPEAEAVWDSSPPPARTMPVRLASAHQMMWMAALARTPFPLDPRAPAPRQLSAAPARSVEAERRAAPGTSQADRWSADTWLLLRRGGSATLANGIAPAVYGASQAGAVLRYRLATQNARRPTAYVRTTAALNGLQEQEAAFGVAARPLAGLPVMAAVELRATSRQSGTGLRPAVLGWTELPPLPLPGGARAEIYGQAGYVGGDFGTPFADGQIRLDKPMMHFGKAELRAGGGVWAGAQKDASRVDVGPGATLGMPVGQGTSARVAVDWRFRLTGNAEPASGPALTLSAGF